MSSLSSPKILHACSQMLQKWTQQLRLSQNFKLSCSKDPHKNAEQFLRMRIAHDKVEGPFSSFFRISWNLVDKNPPSSTLGIGISILVFRPLLL